MENIFGILLIPLIILGMLYYITVPLFLCLTYFSLKNHASKKLQTYIVNKEELKKASDKVATFSILTSSGFFLAIWLISHDMFLDAMCDTECYVGFGDVISLALLIGIFLVLTIITAIFLFTRGIEIEKQSHKSE